ncbi:4'-phosphopantetheinyl transferase family protein [Streptomyces tagetis]|uniref:4'-phosphopantetheinyl transferase superfamily protein n=1 Tax=Streptomyces tagetis TaxID=2820809 RepID=A0A940XL41_9ACTN|nr:4'-phosphopantetheinyl transferase superfamily protein [Streptomyces sp. RG38]MBQ0826670.1 4'-phosphopantetheinyl transferase superfamily protein [Streptomyces sp. RG38]
MSEPRSGRLPAPPAHAPPPAPSGLLCPAVLDLSGVRRRTRAPGPRVLRGPLELYLARVGAQDERALRDARELLDAEERERARAFRHDRDRTAYVVAHAALRDVLSVLLGVRAEALPLAREPCAGCGGPHGRPVLRTPGVHFSLSHSGDLVLVALAPAPVGVDVEGLATSRAVLGAQSALHPAEADELARLPAHGRPAAFTRAWVRKEAYLKGLGTGLVRDPALDYVGTGPLPATPAPGWSVRDVLVPAGYAAAVALRVP